LARRHRVPLERRQRNDEVAWLELWSDHAQQPAVAPASEKYVWEAAHACDGQVHCAYDQPMQIAGRPQVPEASTTLEQVVEVRETSLQRRKHRHVQWLQRTGGLLRHVHRASSVR